VILCDDSRDPRAEARHLVDVGVSAVVGFHRSEEAIDLATSYFVPNHVVVVSTLNQSPLVTKVPQAERLVWRTTVESGAWAEPLAQIVSGVAEPAARAQSRGRKVRVALVRGSPTRAHNLAWLSLATALRERLHLNGSSAVEDADDFREVFTSKDTGDTEGVDAQYTVDQLLEAPPDIVVLGNEVFGAVASSLDARWPAGLTRPRYVATGGNVDAAMLRYFGSDPDRRHRFLATELASRSKANVLLVTRYNEFFEPRITPTFALGPSYDAFYLLAYAAYAAGAGARDGVQLARAIPRLLPPGRAVDVGPSGVFDVVRALANGGTVDLNGAGSSLDLDPETGETRADWDVLCVGVDESGAATSLVPSGLAYHAGARALEGRMNCR
jgi:hypothetical protein